MIKKCRLIIHTNLTLAFCRLHNGTSPLRSLQSPLTSVRNGEVTISTGFICWIYLLVKYGLSYDDPNVRWLYCGAECKLMFNCIYNILVD